MKKIRQELGEVLKKSKVSIPQGASLCAAFAFYYFYPVQKGRMALCAVNYFVKYIISSWSAHSAIPIGRNNTIYDIAAHSDAPC
jgi:hypothetical protein